MPLTLPLLILLTAGTAFGAWLAAPDTLLLVGAISTVIFLGGLALAFKWFTQPAACPPTPQRNGVFIYTQDQANEVRKRSSVFRHWARPGQPRAD